MERPVSNRSTRAIRSLYRLEAWLEAPMFLLALAWLWLFVTELVRGLTPDEQRWVTAIWVLFIAEFALKLTVAPRKWRYLKRNWLTVIALALPAFRTLRLLRALRALRGVRVVTTVRFVRALTSGKRLASNWQTVQGQKRGAEMNVGTLLACSPLADAELMRRFAERLTADVAPEMERATGLAWNFHAPKLADLETNEARAPASFLDGASRHMAAGSYDAILVVTDAGLVSRRRRSEPGLASPVSRTVVISTETLTGFSSRSARDLHSAAVRWNAAALLLHLLGHVAGLGHRARSESEVMGPFAFVDQRRHVPYFSDGERRRLGKEARRLPERELRGGGALGSLLFHVAMLLRHPRALLTLLRNRSVLLPFALPGLATAAVAPALLLVFSSESWDVGLNLANATAATFASSGILAATIYLIAVQSLFFPRKAKQTLTEHLAVANGVIFLSILLACLGLFLLVGGLILLIEIYIFPTDLMQTWPTLDVPEIALSDQLRLAAFISTIGTVTGALAGGLENRAVIQHLALFEDEP
jgi:predicted Zn-dependent protease